MSVLIKPLPILETQPLALEKKYPLSLHQISINYILKFKKIIIIFIKY